MWPISCPDKKPFLVLVFSPKIQLQKHKFQIFIFHQFFFSSRPHGLICFVGLLKQKVAIIHIYLLGDLSLIILNKNDIFYNRCVSAEIGWACGGCRLLLHYFYYSFHAIYWESPIVSVFDLWNVARKKIQAAVLMGWWPPKSQPLSLAHSEPWPFIQWPVQMCDAGDYLIHREQREVDVDEVNREL